MNLSPIISAFQIKGNVISIDTIASGYINTTYKVNTSETSYILQKINHTIFKKVDALTENIIRITAHLKSKVGNEDKDNTLQVIYTKTNVGYHKDTQGYFWRMFNFIPKSKTIEVLESKEQAYTLGESFSKYHLQLLDLPAPKLTEIIPDFHNTPTRIQHFKEAIAKNAVNRLKNVKEEVDYMLELSSQMHEIVDLGNQSKIPLRNIHQDTKLSNILFDEQNNPLCIIDLDTTSSGYLAYDFADAVRTGMNTATEGEKDISKVSLNFSLFTSFAKGYAVNSKSFITPEEVNTLVLGVKIITYEQAIRFLGDYLNGDIYYRTEYADENLVRTRVQIAFLNNILDNFSKMNTFVKGLY